MGGALGSAPRLGDLHPSSGQAQPCLQPSCLRADKHGALGPVEPSGDMKEGDTGAALSAEGPGGPRAECLPLRA